MQMGAARHPGQRPQAQNGLSNIPIIGGIVVLAVVLTSSTMEALIRKNFGERYLDVISSWMFFAMATGLLSLNILPIDIMDILEWIAPNSARTFQVFFLLFSAASIYHLAYIWYRRHKGVFIHSYYWGDSFAFAWLERILPIKGINFQRTVEPAIVIVIGLVIMMAFDGVVGAYIVIGAVAMGWKSYQNWRFERSWILDTLDSWLEADALGSLTNPSARARDTEGVPFVECVPPGMTMAQRKNIADAARFNNPIYVYSSLVNQQPQADGRVADEKARVEHMTARLNPQMQLLLNGGTNGQAADGKETSDE